MMNKYISFLIIGSFLLTAIGVSAEKNSPKAILITPSAPKFSDAERQTELAARRAKVFAEMKDNSVLILMSAAPKVYTNDVDFLYRQENNLYYLTNLKQQDATLVLAKTNGAATAILFVPKRSPQNETWHGKMYSNEEAANLSGIKTIIDASEYENFFNLLKNKQPFNSKTSSFSFTPAAENLYLLTPEHDYETDDTREYQREWDLAKSLSNITTNEKTRELIYGKSGNWQIISANPIFAKLRLIKSPYEIRLIQHAIDITTEAQMRAMATAGQVSMEYETQAEIEYVFRRRNADYWGYPSIVGCGINATTLHYEESQGAVKPGNLLLMDVGAEYNHLTADVTRTFPVNGKFSKEQAEIYQIVYDAQEAAAKKIKPGARFSDPAKAARETVEAGLVKLGLITSVGALIPGTEKELPDGKGGKKIVGTPQSFLWFMHGWGHWLGMNVHDVGGGGITVLQPGMIMTNEPGIYIREDALDYFDLTKPEIKAFVEKIRPAYEKYKTIGVRIEDDMLVTPNGAEWMTGKLPRKISDIEDFMSKSSNEIKIGALQPQPKQPFAVANFSSTVFNSK